MTERKMLVVSFERGVAGSSSVDPQEATNL
jgi:hypothetical protein